MFSRHFILNEQSFPIIEQLGEHMPGGFFIYKADETEELLYANKAVCRIFGCDDLEDFKAFTGFRFQGMIHPDDYDKIQTSIKNQINESRFDLDFVEYRIIRKDGQVRWIEDYGHYVESDVYNGLYYAFISDVTEKHQQNESDKALDTAVIEALTKTYDSVWLINDIETEHFELFRIDPEMEHLLPAHTAVKIKKFSEALTFYSQLVLEEDREAFLTSVKPEIIIRNVEIFPIYSVPFRRLFENGIRYYRLEFAKLDLPDGKTGIVGGFKNVDAEVRRDQQLQHSLNLRSAVIEALTQVYDSVWLINDLETQQFELFRIDQNADHLHPARKAVKIPRFSDAFQFYSRLILEEDRQGFLDAVTVENILKYTADRPIYSVPFRRVFEEKGVRHYRLEFARLELATGETNIVAGFKDVDDEVRKEQQIQQALREAIDAANASSKAKSAFLSSMSHDMRTPMNGIIGMTVIAGKHLDDKERVADCLRKITDSSSHLLSLINEVLDMNKIESGKMELQEEEFCLAELIDRMLAMTRPQIQARQHSFRMNVDVKHEHVIGDCMRIEQVFINILSNAIKYTPNGGKISLHVKELSAAAPGFGHYQFVFEDNGYGMTEEFQKKLFDPFTRANDKQISGIQGTGLGMTITRNIVRMMGGDISVRSVYGEGSRFTVDIFLKLQQEMEGTDKRFADLRVLVVDDDPVCCESSCGILNDMGMNSEWVLSGKAAVERVKTRQNQNRDFFCIIVDWKLPDQNGMETTRQIRELIGEEIPIIILSAYDMTEIEQEARKAGATSFISKPLFRTKLAALFDSLVNKNSSEADMEAPLRSLEEMDLTGFKVLLTEDQELNADIATDFLEMTGLDVDWARDGEQAVEKFASSPDGYYALIFMDVQMPNMNGYEATRAIRAMDRAYAKEIPIIAMTANAFSEDIMKCRNAGMNDHITKPINIDILARVLKDHIKIK